MLDLYDALTNTDEVLLKKVPNKLGLYSYQFFTKDKKFHCGVFGDYSYALNFFMINGFKNITHFTKSVLFKRG